MTNDSQPSTSGLKSALRDLVAGQFTAGSCRAAARALLLENCGDFVSALSATESLLASSIKSDVLRKPPVHHSTEIILNTVLPRPVSRVRRPVCRASH